MMMCTGMADLKKAGIYEEKDLLRFSWEDDTSVPDDDAIEEMRKELVRMNEKRIGR